MAGNGDHFRIHKARQREQRPPARCLLQTRGTKLPSRRDSCCRGLQTWRREGDAQVRATGLSDHARLDPSEEVTPMVLAAEKHGENAHRLNLLIRREIEYRPVLGYVP